MIGTLLEETEYVCIKRKGRYVICELKTDFLSLSASFSAGGFTTRARYLINHQSCEGSGHATRAQEIVEMGQQAYHAQVCRECETPVDESLVLGTAANMRYLSIQQEVVEGIRVIALVTAGVQGNGGRAGDPALYHELEQPKKHLAKQGTINTICIVDHPMTESAMIRSVVTMTEAKSAALQELAVPGKYSEGLATGTGTDQIIFASRRDENETPLTWSGKHTRLGEGLANAVLKATKEALLWQNGLEPSRTRNLFYILERFGLKEAVFEEKMKSELGEEEMEFFKKNKTALIHDPQIAGCAFALATLKDRVRYGSFPEYTVKETMLQGLAWMGSVVAVNPGCYQSIYNELSLENHDFSTMLCKALALGWKSKWS